MKKNKYLAPLVIAILFITSCSNRTPDVILQAPPHKEVVSLDNDVKVWTDYRGIYYYLDDHGNKTNEPLYFSKETCTPEALRRNKGGLSYIFKGYISMYEQLAGRPSHNLPEAIEMQCNARRQWEQGNRYGSRNYYRR